ncbi:MAG: hypothetical protein KDC78_07330 [Aequorivita sp.]|nr:hypothetical protein [Aequorivita sp.]
MGQKKDIGQLFESKLNDAKKIPNKSLWEKINASLDEEKRRKKRIFLYWVLSGGVSVLLGLLLLFGNVMLFNSSSPLNQNNLPVKEQSSIPSKNENNKTPIEISKKNPTSHENKGEEKLSRIIPPEENSKLSETENSIDKNTFTQPATSENNSKKIKPEHKSTDENFTVTKNYYYYNSKDGKQIVTNNKEEIDSLISKQYKSLDSTASKKDNSPAD